MHPDVRYTVEVLRTERNADGNIERWANDFSTGVTIVLKDGTVIKTDKENYTGYAPEKEGDKISESRFLECWNDMYVYTHANSDYQVEYSYPTSLEGSNEEVTATISFLGFTTNYKLHFVDKLSEDMDDTNNSESTSNPENAESNNPSDTKSYIITFLPKCFSRSLERR